MFAVIVNAPAYLPDSYGLTYDTFEDAQAALAGELWTTAMLLDPNGAVVPEAHLRQLENDVMDAPEGDVTVNLLNLAHCIQRAA